MKKLKHTLDNILFLLRPAIKYGKGLLLLMLVIQAIPSLVNSLVTVATPKVAIDGLLNGTPVGRIILKVGLLILPLIPSPSAMYLVRAVFPVPRSPISAMTCPGRASSASSRPKALVASSFSIVRVLLISIYPIDYL